MKSKLQEKIKKQEKRANKARSKYKKEEDKLLFLVWKKDRENKKMIEAAA